MKNQTITETVTQTLMSQLHEMKAHGMPLLGMVGAKQFVGLENGGVKFAVHAAAAAGKNAWKVNKVVINYDAEEDLYNVEYWYVKVTTKKWIMDKTFSEEGVDVEQLRDMLVRHVVDGETFTTQRREDI